MRRKKGRPNDYLGQSHAMENTNLRLTDWHRIMLRVIHEHLDKTVEQGEMGAGARLGIEKLVELLGLQTQLAEQKPKKKNGH